MPRDASASQSGSTPASASPRKAFADRRRDPATKREAVLNTAAQLFLERSYSRTSMNDVADRLNITKPALYHYFNNKEDILIACYRLGVGLIEATLNEIADHGGTGLQKVEAFIRSYAIVMTVNYGRCVMRLDEGDLTSGARTEVRTYKKKIDRRLRAFIQEGIDDGSIASCDTKIAAFSIAGALNWICMWYEPDGVLSPEEIAAQFARTLTQGLVAGQGSGKLRVVSKMVSQDSPRKDSFQGKRNNL
jgi:AcrR family transcriptional regulator